MSSEIDRNPLSALRTAAMFLTRIPVGGGGHAGGALAGAVWAFPAVGALVGFGGAAAFYLADSMGLPVALSAAIAVAGMYLVTGGLHEDGLADVADGFGGGSSRERKLAIMRDSRIGSYGVAALVFSILARVLAVASLGEPGAVCAALIGAGACSRAAIGPVMALMGPARTDGLSAAAGRPSVGQAAAGVAVGFAIAAFAVGFGEALFLAALAAAVAFLIAGLAKRQIGGQTGDVLGTVAQGVEIAVLIALSAR